MWKLPPNQDRRIPLYRRLVMYIEDALERGLLSGGERLPSERELARLLGMNRSTVIRSLEELAGRGVLVRKKGSGTYVRSEKWGLQSYALLHWRPTGLMGASRPGQAGDQKSPGAKPVMDLSGDSLPPDLLPQLSLRDMAWGKVIEAEQGEETALLGMAGFRETIRDFLQHEVGLRVGPDQILITSGTQQSLFLISQALLQPGDAVGVEGPSYFYSLPVFQAAGLRLFALPMDRHGVTLDGLDMQCSLRRLKMIFLNPIFHNPTGTLTSAERKLDILRYCSRRRIPVVEDDAYSLLAFDPGLDTAPIKKFDREDHVIYTGSLSSYAGSNLRAGWLVAPPMVIMRLAQLRRQMDAGLSVLPQLLAQQYLEGSFRTHRLKLWEELALRADFLSGWLKERYGDQLSFEKPRGGLYLYFRVREGRDPEDFLRDLKSQGILPARGTEFGDGADAFRLNFGRLSGLQFSRKQSA